VIRGGRLIVKLANNQIPFSPGYYFFNLPHPLEQVLWSAINRLNAEVEEREEERGEVGCKHTASFDTRIKKFCKIDKWIIY